MEFIKVSLHFIDKSPHDFSEKSIKMLILKICM